MTGPQLPSKDSDRIFHYFVFSFFLFFFNLPLLSHLLVVVFWLSHVRLSAKLWTVAHPAPLSMGFPRQKKKKNPGLEKEHMGRDLWGHRDGKACQEGMSVRKLWVYVRSGQEPLFPGLAVDTAQHPSACLLSVLPYICQECWGLDCGTCWALDTAVSLQVCGRDWLLLMTTYDREK